MGFDFCGILRTILFLSVLTFFRKALFEKHFLEKYLKYLTILTLFWNIFGKYYFDF